MLQGLRRPVPIVVSLHTPRISAVQPRGAFVCSKNSHCHDRNHTFVTVTLVEFRGDLWRQKTRLPGLSCGVVYVILCLAVLVELRLVTDGLTDRHRAMASTADA